MHRFYLPPEKWLLPEPWLDDADAHHATHVLRSEVGDSVVVFDGQGREALATITDFKKKKPLQAVLSLGVHQQTPRPRFQIILAQAVPKGKNMDLIIQKAVELGATRIIPLLSERTILRCANQDDALQKQERWQQIAIEACKQSGQNWLPYVEKPGQLQDFFKNLSPQQDQLLLIASLARIFRTDRGEEVAKSNGARQHSSGFPVSIVDQDEISRLEPEKKSLKEVLITPHKPTKITVMIGPEGDFTSKEYAAAQDVGFQPIDLGPIVLRTETAAIYCLSVLSYELRSSC